MKLHKLLPIGLLAPAIGFLMAPSANAALLTLGYGSQHYGNGGEFLVTSTDGWAASVAANYAAGKSANANRTGFETFCIEYNEHFSPGGTYNYQISPGAIKGGQTTGDPISVGAAYLYGLFAKGTLPGYNYLDGTAMSAKNLQNTLWYLEGERNGLPSGPLIANPGTFNALLTAEFGPNPLVWMADSANSASFGLVNAASFGVAAINMGPAATYPNQDQLIYQGGGFRVPDGGATLILLGMTLSGLTLLKRKFA